MLIFDKDKYFQWKTKGSCEVFISTALDCRQGASTAKLLLLSISRDCTIFDAV
jgi:hypothetical protein